MEKKKKIFTLTACLAVIGMSFGITYAYLTSTQTRLNEFTVGENSIEIVEEFKPPEELKKGEGFDKKVQVKNTGNMACYVRVRVEFSDSEAQEFSTVDYHLDKWKLGDDGYYYYTEALEPYADNAEKGITSPLFEHVTIKSAEEYTPDLIDFDIYVYSESCEKGSYKTYQEAWAHAAGEEVQP